MSVRISPNPVYQLNDQSGDPVLVINNDGSTTATAGQPPVGLIQNMVKVILTAAQLKALKATPIVILPAPGAGKAYVVDQVSLHYQFVTTAYTLNAGTFQLFLGAPANTNPLFADVANGLLTAVANRNILGIPVIKSTTDTDAHLLNVDIEAANTGGAEFTLGDGTLEIAVMYTTIVIP